MNFQRVAQGLIPTQPARFGFLFFAECRLAVSGACGNPQFPQPGALCGASPKKAR